MAKMVNGQRNLGANHAPDPSNVFIQLFQALFRHMPEDLLSDKVQYYDRAAKTLGRKQEKGLLERLSENKAKVQEKEAKEPKERHKTRQEPSL